MAGKATIPLIHHRMEVRKAGSIASGVAAWTAEPSRGAHGAHGAHLDRAAYKGVDRIVVSKDTSECFVSTSTRLVGAALESFDSGDPVSWRGDDLGDISSMSIRERRG